MRTAPLLIACALALLGGVSRAADNPNVVFIAVDDMNDWVGHLGATPRAITPTAMVT